METITKDKFIKIFKEKSISLFTYSDLFKIFPFSSESSAKSLLSRLKKSEIVKQLARGKYLFNFAFNQLTDFEIANFLYRPSYVSLESALSFYELIDQFPYETTSVCLQKTKTFSVGTKKYSYNHLDSSLFKDYIKQDNYLIATPIKALFDFIYLVYKGSRSKNNLSLLKIDQKTRKELKNYLKKDAKLLKFCQNQKIL